MARDTGMDFEALYHDEPADRRLIPWDIGRPQPAVTQLVAYGAVRGDVLDPGTGPGYHAVHYALHGLSATGVDDSPSAIERAERNAEKAGARVEFRVADATRLDGFEDRFDTVVDSAFYHVFLDDEQTQTDYVRALHRATRPGARLFMFEFGRHNVNGVHWEGLPADNFDRVLEPNGWRLDYLGTSTYLAYFGPETLENMADMSSGSPAWAERMRPLQDQLKVIAPLLEDHLVHMPVWAVAATRLG